MISNESVIKVAKISGVDQKRGYFVLELLADFPDSVESCRHVFIDIQGRLKSFEPEVFEKKQHHYILRLKGIDAVADKFLFDGRDVYIPAEFAGAADPDVWYIKDLIGSRVVKNGTTFGVIEEIYQLKPNDVYLIKKADGEEYLLPALKQFIKGFNSSEKVLILHDGEEFYED